jgi:hypothetical protein
VNCCLGGCGPYRCCDSWGVQSLRGWKLSDRIRFVTAAAFLISDFESRCELKIEVRSKRT